MRLPVIAGVCIVLIGAMTAQAGLIDVTTHTVLNPAGVVYADWFNPTVTYSGVMSYTRTALDSSVDEIDIYLNNIELMGGTAVTALEGMFTAANGMGVIQKYSTNTRPWYRYTDNTYTPPEASGYDPDAHGSYVNLPYNNSTTFLWAETAGGSFPEGTIDKCVVKSETTLFGGYYGDGIVDGQLFASIFVTTGGGVKFRSSVNLTTPPDPIPSEQFPPEFPSGYGIPGGWGMAGNVTTQGEFSIPAVTTPEPSTLLLAATGLVGLLCYAWRKRRS